jgi:hypothetical protein
MDDLSGLDWNQSSNPPKSSTPSFPTLRPSPTPSGSGRSTPVGGPFRPPSAANSTPSLKFSSKPGTPANDSFASLLGAPKATNNLSLQERQRQLLEEKAQKEADEKKRLEAQFGPQHGTFWEGMGGPNKRAVAPEKAALKQGGPALSQSINAPFSAINRNHGTAAHLEDDDDILAAFKSSAPVNSSSHFPPAQLADSGRSTPTSTNIASKIAPTRNGNNSLDFDDDDDPFGLSQFTPKPRSAPPPASRTTDDDDILGMLGRPVDEVAASVRQETRPPQPAVEDDGPESVNPQAKAVAELVDMGFPADKSAEALLRTESGLDVQAAVGILLNQAHEESKQKARNRTDSSERVGRQPQAESRDRNTSRGKGQDDSMPSWMRNQDDSRSSSQNRTQASAKEKDVTQYATEIGSTLFKSANSLWKSGQKKIQKTVAELQQEGDSSQPKWMRDAQLAEAEARRPRRSPDSERAHSRTVELDVTNEALMLEARDERPRNPSRSATGSQSSMRPSVDKLRPQSSSPNSLQEFPSARRAQPAVAQQLPSRPAARLTRQDLENDTPEVYISPARRRNPQTTPRDTPPPDQAPSLPARSTKSPLTSPPLKSNNPFSNNPFNGTSKPPTKPQPRATPSPAPARPKAPPRQIPPASSSALSTSASNRQAGSEAFKRGDYASAHAAYATALQPLPSSHPICIVIFCNRALTNIKVGDSKAAIADADSALGIIGVSRGEGEKIKLGHTEGEKDMKEFYGKALMRKAEALENLEKWSDAAKIWREAVEAGVGGSISIQGRERCEKAAGGGAAVGQAPTQAKKLPPKKPPPPRASALDALARKRPTVNHAASAEAVKKLREATAAAEKADDEKFALTDHVDAKLISWKGTKADNLRSLLGSLDKVLWPEAGWNKVGMQDLVMPNRVKIIYMKAIAKVHPDKVSHVPQIWPLW